MIYLFCNTVLLYHCIAVTLYHYMIVPLYYCISNNYCKTHFTVYISNSVNACTKYAYMYEPNPLSIYLLIFFQSIYQCTNSIVSRSWKTITSKYYWNYIQYCANFIPKSYRMHVCAAENFLQCKKYSYVQCSQ